MADDEFFDCTDTLPTTSSLKLDIINNTSLNINSINTSNSTPTNKTIISNISYNNVGPIISVIPNSSSNSNKNILPININNMSFNQMINSNPSSRTSTITAPIANNPHQQLNNQTVSFNQATAPSSNKQISSNFGFNHIPQVSGGNSSTNKSTKSKTDSAINQQTFLAKEEFSNILLNESFSGPPTLDRRQKGLESAPPSTNKNKNKKLMLDEDLIFVKDLNTGKAVRVDQLPLPQVFGEPYDFEGDTSPTQNSADHPKKSIGDISGDISRSKEENKSSWFTSFLGDNLSFSKKDSTDKTKNELIIKAKFNNRTEQTLSDLKLGQGVMSAHNGPIWTMKFSHDGSYLATAGQDSTVFVWLVIGSPAELTARENQAGNGTPKGAIDGIDPEAFAASKSSINFGFRKILHSTPLRIYAGHKSDVTDLSWSKSNFLISSSMDKTVRLWHVSRPKCLKMFQHADCVTQCSFHPTEERYFLSGSLDKKLRVWNIPESRVVDWAPTSQMITSVAFTPSGKMAVAGLYTGEVIFYQTDGLKYFTQIECKNRRGKDSNGRKVTGLDFMYNGKKLLITTNDSRLRIYDMEDFSQKQKLKGLENSQLQIKATFSEDGKHIICGSEDSNIYFWDALKGESKSSFFDFSSKEETNSSYEYFKAFSSTATVAIFAPRSTINYGCSSIESNKINHIIIAASYDGEIKAFENIMLPKP